MMRLNVNFIFKFIISPIVFAGFALLTTSCEKPPASSGSVNTGQTGTTGSTESTGATGATGTTSTTVTGNGIPLKNMFGINMYEWNMEGPTDGTIVNEPDFALLSQSFTGIRHYMDWQQIENTEDSYTFNPTRAGGWSYDAVYTRCKAAGMFILVDLKNAPDWIQSTYPKAQRSVDVVPIPYGLDKGDPASYVKQARAAFQFAARYGSNANISKALLTVNTTPRWTGDEVNQVLVGLNLVKYLECGNEEDKWWEGAETQVTPEQYAANLSAFYDGNMGKLGNNAGVKTADPTMMVVLGGLAADDPTWITRIVAWCKTNRGLNADGSVNVCFDVINYHYYSNASTGTSNTVGEAPELSIAGQIADNFVALPKSLNLKAEVWITESGYDINKASTQAAIAIGSKSALVTQADWILRSALLYERHGLNRSFFYQFFDDTPNGTVQYQTSGLAEESTISRRPAADYIVQTNALMGNYTYVKTISQDPLVDVYTNGSKVIYALMIPDQKGRTGTFTISTTDNSPMTLYTPKVGANAMTATSVTPVGHKLTVNVSETPVFVGN